MRTVASIEKTRRADEAIGVILIRRSEVRPFTERQIELAETFADQAVIAIENTRLFEEVPARTKELQELLDRQTATSEVLGVISRSPNAWGEPTPARANMGSACSHDSFDHRRSCLDGRRRALKLIATDTERWAKVVKFSRAAVLEVRGDAGAAEGVVGGDAERCYAPF